MTAKTQAKKSAKNAKAAAPLVPVVIELDFKPLHALIVADHKAVLAEGKAGQTVYSAFAALLRAIPYAAPGAVASVLADQMKVFGDAYPDKLAIRKTIIQNARKVATGGKAGDKHVTGKGDAAVHAVLDTCTSLRDLRKAMSEAKPEALKDARGATKKPVSAKTKPDAVKPSEPVVKKAPDAFQAAVSILRQCENFLAAGTDAGLIGKIEELVRMLETKEISARMPADVKGAPKMSKAA